MATRTLKTRLAFDGEKEYKQALSELNSGSRVLASEMKKLKAEYQGNADSSEFLAKKGELLERQLLQQKDKVETLRKALQACVEQNGESAESTQKWAISLNNAEAEMYDLENAINQNREAMNGENTAMVGLGDTVQQLAGKLGVNLPDGAVKALNGMKSLSAGSVAAMGAAVAAVAGLVKGVKELHQTTLEAAAEVDEVITESMITGLSAETIQQLKYAENLIDVSYGTISGSLTKLTRNIAEARDGNESLATAFQTLGVAIEDTTTGQLRSAEDVFYDIIDALGQVGNTTERDALAMELMGKSAQDLNPLILSGSDALRELASEAEATGYVLDESQIAVLGQVDDAYQRMQLQLQATKKELADEFAPASQKAMETFTEWVGKATDALERSGIVTFLSSVSSSLLDILDSGLELITGIPGLTSELNILKVTLAVIAEFFALIADTIDVFTGLVNLDFDRVKTGLGLNYYSGQASNFKRTVMQFDGTYDQYQAFYAGRNASGNDNWRGGLTYLSEGGTEAAILPRGTRILNAQDTAQALGGDTFYVTIDAKNVREFNDIVEMARSERVRRRME